MQLLDRSLGLGVGGIALREFQKEVRCGLVLRRLFTWTRRISAPASAKASAMACPIPRVPPVIRAVCPSRENIEGNAEAFIIVQAFVDRN